MNQKIEQTIEAIDRLEHRERVGYQRDSVTRYVPQFIPLLTAADLKALVTELRRHRAMMEAAVSVEVWIEGRNDELRAMTGGSWRIWGGNTYSSVLEAFEALSGAGEEG